MNNVSDAAAARLNVYLPEAGLGSKNLMATDMGMASCDWVKVNAHRYSPQTGTKVKIATTIIPLLANGSMIRVNIWKGLAPSMRAASSSSPGMVEKTPRMMNVPNPRYQPA